MNRCLALLVVLCVPALAHAEGPTTVIVSKLKAERGVDEGLAAVLQELVLAELQKYDTYSAIADQDISELIALEMKKDLMGCTEDTCLADIGGALGVEKILTGSVSRLGSQLTITLRLLNVQTTSVDRRATKQARNEDEAALTIRKMLPIVLGTTATKPTERAAMAGRGRLVVVTRPSGAEIFVDSENVGTTPVTVKLTGGEHTLAIELTDFVAIAKRVTVVPDSETRVLESLVRQTGGIDVRTVPAGAKVFLDDEFRGPSPMTIREIPTGRHKLKLTLARHESKELDVDVKYRANSEVRIALVPLPGKVLFSSTPPGAEVWLNGEERGETTKTLELAPGQYGVSFILDGYVVLEKSLEVAPATPATLSVVLEPGETIRPAERRFPWEWVSAGATGAALAGAIAMGALAVGARNDARALPAGHPDVDGLVSKGERLAIGADVVGAATIGLGVLTYFMFRDAAETDW